MSFVCARHQQYVLDGEVCHYCEATPEPKKQTCPHTMIGPIVAVCADCGVTLDSLDNWTVAYATASPPPESTYWPNANPNRKP